jgi:RNA-directed DNA polymerase
MNATVMPAYEWKDLPWRTIERRCFKLQKRIYRASDRGDVKTVHSLQRLILKSWSAKCLAVRRVTQDNRGRKTAGIDGVKKLTPAQRLTLVRDLNANRRPLSVRRVWIPKPRTKDEKRPLGIPVMHDRAAQALVKLALEPEWEAKFEPHSYGFRPGRSCHDAIQAIHNAVRYRGKYVLDADIAKCFDRINHHALLAKTGAFPMLRRILRHWLKAGVMDGERLFPTEEGTPQGGVISPLLANIALHGMEALLRERFRTQKPRLVRYADDFVVLHPDRDTVKQVQQAVAEWLTGMGLELKPEKTRIAHTLEGERPGFDFLGFTVRQFRVTDCHSDRMPYGKLIGFKAIIKPSKEGVKAHYRVLAQVVEQHMGAPQEALIARLGPIITGWTRYYSTQVSRKTFSRMDRLLGWKLIRWGKHRHPRKTLGWVWRRYWREKPKRFATPDGIVILPKHSDVPIRRHVKVRGSKSPFDGDWVYWATRLGRHPELEWQVARLLRRQHGRCALCGLYFKAGDVIENDHIIRREHGGSGGDTNRQLLHGHCHDSKSIQDKDQAAEEPNAAKVARSVLETGGFGRPARRV